MIGAVLLAVTVVIVAGIAAGRVAAGVLWRAVRAQGDPRPGLAGRTASAVPAAAVISPGRRPVREPHCRHTEYEPNSATRV